MARNFRSRLLFPAGLHATAPRWIHTTIQSALPQIRAHTSHTPRLRVTGSVCLLLASALAGLFVLPSGLEAQSTGRSGLTVQVADGGGSPVREATVRLLLSSGGAVAEPVRTDRRGIASFDGLAPGLYDVRVERVGYRPFLLQQVVAGPSVGSPVRVSLRSEAPPVTRVDSARYVGGGTLRRSATRAAFLTQTDRERLPVLHISPFQGVEGAATAEPLGSSQGLPFRMGQWELDGFPLAPARHPWSGASILEYAFPQAPVAYLGIPETGLDMGMPGVAAPGLLSQGRPVGAQPDFTAELRGWSSQLWSSDGAPADVPSTASISGSALALLPAARDGDGLVLAFEGGRTELPRALGPTGSWGPLLQGVASQTEPVQRTTSYAGLAHGSYAPAADTDLEATLTFGGGTSTGHPLGGGTLALGDLRPLEARHGSLSARASHRVSPELTLDGRLGFQMSRVSHGETGEGLALVPSTWIVDDGNSLGLLPGGESEVERRSIFASVSAQPDLPDLGSVRLGGQVRLTNFDYRHLFGTGGEFQLASAADAVPQGRYVQTGEPASFRGYSRLDAGLFGEYQVNLGGGLDVGVGFRYDWESYDNPALLPDSVWARLSGVTGSAFDAVEDRVLNGALRVDWRPESLRLTSIHGVVGVRHGETDPSLLNEVHRMAPGVVRQTWEGDFASWPGVTGAPSDESIALALLGPEFSRPRTLWAVAGLSRGFGADLTLTLSGGVRQTDFLPLRRDLNASRAPTAVDQFGRPVYGALEARGSWMGPALRSNRRFLGYDNVWAIDSDGWSHHVWGTASIDAQLSSVELFGSLTVSQTEDNWLGAGAAHPEAGRDPRLGAASLDWTTGTSDLDFPIRGLTAITLKPVESLDLTASYRFRSGRPFTPSFRAGVDANGDGSGLNDPAHIPDAQALGSLAQAWPCLLDQVGQFAGRNSCRGSSIHRLDVQATVGLPVRGATLLFEALNVMDQGEELLDGALWLLDGDPQSTGPGFVQVPYVLNPSFGQPVRQLGIGRVFRVGVRVDL